jgi:1-acyl-sn-glycerol-3-phosphate acyltransferase
LAANFSNRGGIEITMIATVLAAAARMVAGARVRWIDCTPETHQRIYFANHTSHFDFVVLWSALPPELRTLTRPVAAQDYWDKGAVRRYLVTRIFNGVLVARSQHGPGANPEGVVMAARDTVNRVAEALGTRNSLIIFPEGTRGTGAAIASFKSGLYHLCCQRPDVELVPVYLENLNRILPKGSFLPIPLLSSVTFGPPIHFSNGEDKATFLGRTREALCNLKPT